jgi:phosphoglycerate dehydrogenase-like enzyme
MVADLDVDVEVCYPEELLPRQRFSADHVGDPEFARSPTDDAHWRDLLAHTDIALGIPGDSAAGFRDLVALAPHLRWVQGTAAGTGEQVTASGVDAGVLRRVVVTSAAGVHATPLAEFAVFGLLAFAKDIDRLLDLSDRHEWGARWPMRQLAASTVAVIGLGAVGREVARLLGAFGTTVYGVHRKEPRRVVEGVTFDASVADLDALLPRCDAVVVALPGTKHTRQLFDARRLALLPRHAVLVNVGRGTSVETAALVAALDSGRLRGAAVDVTELEPLPEESPLWGRPNVIVSPHTAALTADEDDRIVDLFCHNLKRFVRHQPLRNLVHVERGY